MQIMIVDDDAISRRLLEKIVADLGHGSVIADNGREAWEKYQHTPVQVVITDWMMPEMDGIELCRKIRSHPIDHYAYVITLTSRSQKNDLLQVFESGADDYIAKPFDPEELKARIKTSERIVNLESRHRSLQHTLIESRHKVRVVFDSLEEEIVSVDEDLILISANNRFLQTLGGEYGDNIGKKITTASRENDKLIFKPEVIERIASVFTEGKSQQYLDTFTNDHGETCYHQVSCLPIKGNESHIEQVVIVTKDITDDRRKREEIKSLNARVMQSAAQLETKNATLEETLSRLEATQAQIVQQEKMASIGQLAAGVAHEINNPTGFVSSNLKTLQDYFADINTLVGGYRNIVNQLTLAPPPENLPEGLGGLLQDIQAEEKRIDIDFLQEDVTELIQDCREGTDRIKKIVLDLKDFAHPGDDKLQYTDINKGLQSTLNVVNNEIKYKAIVNTDFGELPLVECFAQELNQVFMNLLVNAAQAMEESGEIVVRTRHVDGQVTIEISDNGVGIEPENLNRIFDPFFTTKDVGKGTGLGMHIAYKIIRKHKGNIRVESTPGEGTTFFIQLPVLGEKAE